MSARLDRRLAALSEAVEVADGRLEPERVEAARAVVRRAGERLGLGVEATVVALAGPTGAGKSTLFNALAGAHVSAAGRLRPTTATATAAMWGEEGGALVAWLEVPRRHRVEDGGLPGLVLLDLPDFDSVEVSHRLEVDRLIELVDVVVWVVDPQKYADASLHERYLRPLSAYDETMVVALNQADLLAPEALAACQADLRRLLTEDGLDGVPVLSVSAVGDGDVDPLRRLLAERVRARRAAVARLAADVTSAARALRTECGERASERIPREDRDRLLAALAGAAGVPAVVRATARAHRRRGALATGWPLVRWVRRLRPDPLRRLRLGGERPDPGTRSSLPSPSPVARSQVAAATRALAARAGGDLPGPWPGLVRSAATAAEDRLADRLDRAVAGADLHMRRPLWWRVAGLLQVLLALAAAVGALWLLALAVLGYLQLGEAVPLPMVESIPLPTLLLGGGLLAGLLLAFLFGLINAAGARRRSRAAARALRRAVEEVAQELAIDPVQRELAAYNRLCDALAVASGERSRRG